METKSIFEMTDSELQQTLGSAAETIRKRAWDKVGCISYYDADICPGIDYIVREYRDRKELIRLNEAGGSELIRTL